MQIRKYIYGLILLVFLFGCDLAMSTNPDESDLIRQFRAAVGDETFVSGGVFLSFTDDAGRYLCLEYDLTTNEIVHGYEGTVAVSDTDGLLNVTLTADTESNDNFTWTSMETSESSDYIMSVSGSGLLADAETFTPVFDFSWICGAWCDTADIDGYGISMHTAPLEVNGYVYNLKGNVVWYQWEENGPHMDRGSMGVFREINPYNPGSYIYSFIQCVTQEFDFDSDEFLDINDWYWTAGFSLYDGCLVQVGNDIVFAQTASGEPSVSAFVNYDILESASTPAASSGRRSD